MFNTQSTISIGELLVTLCSAVKTNTRGRRKKKKWFKIRHDIVYKITYAISKQVNTLKS